MKNNNLKPQALEIWKPIILVVWEDVHWLIIEETIREWPDGVLWYWQACKQEDEPLYILVETLLDCYASKLVIKETNGKFHWKKKCLNPSLKDLLFFPNFHFFYASKCKHILEVSTNSLIEWVYSHPNWRTLSENIILYPKIFDRSKKRKSARKPFL